MSFKRLLQCGTLLLAIVSSLSWAAAQEITLLDNRFRVDPTIKQASFVIYRAQGSQPVVLVRPDGTKYYSWRHPDHVAWYEEDGMDIISIDSPMPGPWQAIGAVTPKNNIKIISDLKLDVDPLSPRLYHDERVKLEARLTNKDKPIVLRDFLDRVSLKVTFTPYVEHEHELAKEARPVSVVIGEFADDGQGHDEVAGDGKFTVELPISVDPGKYRVRVTSGNGVFLRAVEQVVLVYPNPLEVEFVQSREETGDHSLSIIGEKGTIKPGSMSAHITVNKPKKQQLHYTPRSSKAGYRVTSTIPYSEDLGTHVIESVVYATDVANERELVLDAKKVSFGVSQTLDVTAAQERMRQAQLKLEREQMLQQMEQKRAEDRKRSLIIIIIGNVIVLALGVVAAIIVRKRRAKAADEPELQLTAPPTD